METWMITGTTGFLGPRVEVALREKEEVKVLPMTRRELDVYKRHTSGCFRSVRSLCRLLTAG